MQHIHKNPRFLHTFQCNLLDHLVSFMSAYIEASKCVESNNEKQVKTEQGEQ